MQFESWFRPLNLFLLFIGTVGLALATLALVWRGSTKTRSLPCPPWLSWMLENPYMTAVAGSATLLDRVHLKPGMRVLDAGCGPGRLSIPMAKRVGDRGLVVALDIQSAMLKKLKERAVAAGAARILPVLGGLGTGLLKPNVFDRAVLVTVLGEIPNRKDALREVWTSLKPGGILSVTEVLPDPHYQRRSTVCRLAEEAGFRVQNEHGNWVAFTLNFLK